MLTHDRLRDILEYDSTTGIFRRNGIIAGTNNAKGYRQISIDGRRYYAHRLAWLYAYGEWPADEVDHINADKGDNRLCNLRCATRSQNRANTYALKRNPTGLKGASFHKRSGKYQASIQVDNQVMHLGYFSTAEAAHCAYLAAAEAAHGEFVRK